MSCRLTRANGGERRFSSRGARGGGGLYKKTLGPKGGRRHGSYKCREPVRPRSSESSPGLGEEGEVPILPQWVCPDHRHRSWEGDCFKVLKGGEAVGRGQDEGLPGVVPPAGGLAERLRVLEFRTKERERSAHAPEAPQNNRRKKSSMRRERNTSRRDCNRQRYAEYLGL